MSRENNMMKMFNELEDDNQCILLSNAYDLLRYQEQEKERSGQIAAGSKLFEMLERLENIRVVR